MFDLYVKRRFTPFHLMVFDWSDSAKKFHEFVWGFDVWFSEKSQRILEMPAYFPLVSQHGIETVVQHVSRVRKDFHGDRLSIQPQYAYFIWWHWWKEFTAVPLRHHQPRHLQPAYLGSILRTFANLNNFTFDTVPWDSEDQRGAQIHILNSIWCLGFAGCNGVMLSCNTLQHTSTLMSSQVPTVSPYSFPSLRVPVQLTTLIPAGFHTFHCPSFDQKQGWSRLFPRSLCIHLDILLTSHSREAQFEMALQSLAPIHLHMLQLFTLPCSKAMQWYQKYIFRSCHSRTWFVRNSDSYRPTRSLCDRVGHLRIGF